MRTGPFSDPIVVTLINRYFVPVHLNNIDGSGIRYNMPPGHEDAYFILETPETADGPEVESITYGWSDGHDGPVAAENTHVLEPRFMKQEMLKFLGRHSQLDHEWPELARLKDATDPASRLRRAELLLDEGAADQALALLDAIPRPLSHTARARARALRQQKRWDEAAGALSSAPAGPTTKIEKARIAFERGDARLAEEVLNAFLARHPDHIDAAEAYYRRGWLHFRAGDDDAALEVWREGIARHPVTKSLFSQKAHLTLIRQNWSIDTVARSDTDTH